MPIRREGSDRDQAHERPAGRQAEELIAFAIELAAFDAQGEAEVKKLLADAGIED